MRNIDLIREVTAAAAGRWPDVLSLAGITVPQSPRQHSTCPACGGNDRFRFDDGGRGSHFCNQCGAGDGLDLVAKVNRCDTSEAARIVADTIGIDYRVTETNHEAASQRREQMEARRLQREQERQQRADTETSKRRKVFTGKYQAMAAQAKPGESAYLIAKGLDGFTYPVLPDGSLLLALYDEFGTVTAAQTITPMGVKRLLTGSAKKGAFHAVNAQEKPQSIIIAEGLASALTAHLMRPDALTVAAIDAGNLLPVAQLMRQQHPDAQIIIAGDNDWHMPGELDENGKPKQNIGLISTEKSAKSVNGWASLPPTEHEADWDDYRHQNGLDAAITAFNESMYQPQGKAVTVQLKAIEGGKKDHQGADPLKPHVVSRKDGVFWITPKVDKESGEIINNEAWLCSPLEVVGLGRYESDDYLILCWIPVGADKPVTRSIPAADIGEREGWRSLKAGGVSVTTKNQLRAVLADWLQRTGTRELWSVTPRSGWHCGAYIMPDGEVIGTPDQPVLFRGGSAAAAGYSVHGTVESWRDSVARLVRGNPSMMLGIATALAAPLVGLVQADGFGVHLFARSSAGKTTTANIATSLYGQPDLLRLTWYGTALGIANEAEAHNDGLLPLDEVGQGARAQDVATSAYTLFNGKGKLQSKAEGGNRALRHWRTVAISTGEHDIETFLLNEGIRPNAGQLVRLLNVPMEKSVVHHEHKDGKQHAWALKQSWEANHGAAGREWIRWLAEHKQEVNDALKTAATRWLSLIPADYGEQVHRVADRFAILEAALLMGRVITGWSEQECRDAIQYNFNLWVQEFGTGNKEIQRIIEQAEGFLNAYGFSRYLPHPETDARDLPIKKLAGYREEDKVTGRMKFHTFRQAFQEEISQGVNYKTFASVLIDAGMLWADHDGGHTRKTLRVGDKQQRFYVLMYAPDSAESE
ncbi:TOPRIM and DUF927 domain-containing protein [Rahnella woolbedingensis]|uniref:DUF927 domain-containing protein n=1 Tax=Rahnella woolbedingensis TaxID=1510574 RepID=A0A419N9X1_9GAMM|nr:TOPRIM and DUF927 domain-containing protein [Rahnella woolbedingensis]RJT44537.1 DUF927 domain-containing protein [Rahnella woolbedingensis]